MTMHEGSNPAAHNTPSDSQALSLAVRRELALQATDAVSEILDVDVTIRSLLYAAETEKPTRDRLIARRALRTIKAVIDEDSRVMKAIGQDGIYDYAEGVINYGASDNKYLALVEAFQLSAAEATGLYALREQIAEQTNGKKPGFDQILDALSKLSMSVYEAANDPESALAAFDEAGFITDHVTYERFDRMVDKQFDMAIFHPKQIGLDRIVEGDPDGSRTEAIQDGLKEELRRPVEEVEDESWRPASSVDYLKILGL